MIISMQMTATTIKAYSGKSKLPTENNGDVMAFTNLSIAKISLSFFVNIIISSRARKVNSIR